MASFDDNLQLNDSETMDEEIDELSLSGVEYESDENSVNIININGAVSKAAVQKNAILPRGRGRPPKQRKDQKNPIPIKKKPIVPRGRGRPPNRRKDKLARIIATGKGRGRPKNVQKLDVANGGENSGAVELEDDANNDKDAEKRTCSPKKELSRC